MAPWQGPAVGPIPDRTTCTVHIYYVVWNHAVHQCDGLLIVSCGCSSSVALHVIHAMDTSQLEVRRWKVQNDCMQHVAAPLCFSSCYHQIALPMSVITGPRCAQTHYVVYGLWATGSKTLVVARLLICPPASGCLSLGVIAQTAIMLHASRTPTCQLQVDTDVPVFDSASIMHICSYNVYP